MKSTSDIRNESQQQCDQLGAKFNPNLPLLDVCLHRSNQDVIARVLAMHVCVASSYGYPKSKAMSWLEQEGLVGALTGSELEYVQAADQTETSQQWKVEAIWTLSFAGQIHEDLNFGVKCSDSLITMLPELKNFESSEGFRGRFSLRDEGMLLGLLDLAYCLHWDAVERDLPFQRTERIRQRRRALEWLFTREDWDLISLDT
jgi:hypothetical protein